MNALYTLERWCGLLAYHLQTLQLWLGRKRRDMATRAAIRSVSR